MDELRWRKSSRSNSNGGACVEVAAQHERVLVRDTKERDGGIVTVPLSAWRAFTGRLRGE
ncbi:protein of unknown function [Haloechinothrix alba]|uniref:DUF397 domain-containing protein n=2 Tax=Haloechinothrix TaxID=1425377 RepID=A0A238XTW1_9PSEU|nr:MULTISPECIES: DUF397 domain-containing protein [Haloechinothrix]MBA0127860.1 DUF397 domain-containing protein [Haloechinothrix aidingensis]SNR61951.1 protein of unknown function [Haloechinothrix alba]